MFDTDGNGVIDFNEFVGLWQYVCDWQESFRSFDTDSSGTIDRNELKAGLVYCFHMYTHIYFYMLWIVNGESEEFLLQKYQSLHIIKSQLSYNFTTCLMIALSNDILRFENSLKSSLYMYFYVLRSIYMSNLCLQ